MHTHQNGVIEDFIRNVNVEEVAKEAEAISDGAVLAAKDVVGINIENNVRLTQFGLPAKTVNVIFCVLQKASKCVRPAVWYKTGPESKRRK